MKFNYQARTEDGQVQSGIIEARDKEGALEVLQRHGLYVTFLEEEDARLYEKQISLFGRVSRKDIVLFSRQLAIMFKAGVPIIESLRSIADQNKKVKMKEQVNKIADKVESGSALSEALAAYPKSFEPFYLGMIKSGEVSGKLSETLDFLAGHLEDEHNFNNKIYTSLIYPGFVMSVFFAIMLLLVIFIFPKLGTVFEEMELPVVTRIVLGSGEFIIKFWWAIILVLGGAIYSLIKIIKSEKGKKFFDNLIIRIPFFGEFFKKINLVRIAENLSTLIVGGLPIVQALEVTGDILSNDVYKKMIHEIKDRVRKGELISSVMIDNPQYFPGLFTQMVIVGEKTGKIDSSLKNVVVFYKGDIERGLDSMVKLIEPMMIILLGGLVGVLVLSVFLPIYQMAL